MEHAARPIRQSRAQRTRAHIVESALTVFAERGFPETSMEEICVAAGCSKGGLYHHFRTKTAILAEVVERLRALDGLEPPLGGFSAATGIPEALAGRLLVDVWAAASREPELARRLSASPASNVIQVGELVQRTLAAQLASAASDLAA